MAFSCRACGGTDGALILDLGVQPLANNLLRPEDLGKPEPKFPLRLFLCRSCWLLQIGELVPPVELFSDYLYFSSFSDSMLRHASEAAERYAREFHLGRESLVIEIASNDGYLLRNFRDAGIPCFGIEPAANVARVAEDQGIETIVDFFGMELARKLKNQGRQADLVLGNNVLAHVPAINDFVAGLRELLKPGGRIVLEFPYAVPLFTKTEFDTIYHEHVFYFTLGALVPLFERHELSLFRVDRLPIHGGSLRIFVAQAGRQAVEASVDALLEREEAQGIRSMGFYEGFAEGVATIKDRLSTLLRRLRQEGESLAAYGAAAKGSVLLNYCGIGADVLEFVADRSTYKQGRLTPGTHLPVVPPARLLERMPDYTLLLAWNLADEILEQQRTYRERGGKFILPIPGVAVV